MVIRIVQQAPGILVLGGQYRPNTSSIKILMRRSGTQRAQRSHVSGDTARTQEGRTLFGLRQGRISG